MSRENSFNERLVARADLYRHEFRFYSRLLHVLRRKRKNANLFEKIRLSKLIKNIENDRKFAERKYNLLQPSVE